MGILNNITVLGIFLLSIWIFGYLETLSDAGLGLVVPFLLVLWRLQSKNIRMSLTGTIIQTILWKLGFVRMSYLVFLAVLSFALQDFQIIHEDVISYLPCEQEIRKILLVNDPSRLSQVESLLLKFKGREKELLKLISDEFRREPSNINCQPGYEPDNEVKNTIESNPENKFVDISSISPSFDTSTTTESISIPFTSIETSSQQFMSSCSSPAPNDNLSSLVKDESYSSPIKTEMKFSSSSSSSTSCSSEELPFSRLLSDKKVSPSSYSKSNYSSLTLSFVENTPSPQRDGSGMTLDRFHSSSVTTRKKRILT